MTTGSDRNGKAAVGGVVRDHAVTFILIIISIPSSPRSFIPDLKPSFSANPSRSAAFPFFFRTDNMDFPRLFTVTSEHVRFYFLVFLFYTF